MNTNSLPVVSVTNKIEKPLVTNARTHMPYMFGLEDGQAKRLCVPEMMWGSRDQQVAYCIGYQRTGGTNETTQFFLGERN